MSQFEDAINNILEEVEGTEKIARFKKLEDASLKTEIGRAFIKIANECRNLSKVTPELTYDDLNVFFQKNAEVASLNPLVDVAKRWIPNTNLKKLG